MGYLRLMYSLAIIYFVSFVSSMVTGWWFYKWPSKKDPKTPSEEIKRAERLMTDYYEEKGKETFK